MARAYDAITAPGGKTISAAIYQAKRPGGRVLVNGGFINEVTHREKISLISTPLWVDASYTNSGAIWLGGVPGQPPYVGGPQIYT